MGGRPSCKYRKGQEAHPEVNEGLGGPPRGPEQHVGLNTSLDLRMGLPNPPGSLGGQRDPSRGVQRPYQRGGRGRVAHPEVREGR